MNIFSIILDSILSYIRRNPLTVTIVIMIAVFAPSLFGAALIGLLIGALLLLIGPLILLWRLHREARRLGREGDNFGKRFGGFYTNFDGRNHTQSGGFSDRERFSGGFGGGFGGRSSSQNSQSRAKTNTPNEGQVRVFTTSEQPQKRVKDNVGDYVEFEEVKQNK